MTTQGLQAQIDQVTARALASGALVPIATEHEIVQDQGIPFVVHILARLERKELATGEQKRTGVNPFLPPDPELTVAELSRTHLCVLNKFNVIDRHLLIITRAFEDQQEFLTVDDLHALAVVMAEIGGLGFYNAGTVAGASQPHKHLQLVPLPLGPGPLPTPVDSVLGDLQPGRLQQVPGLDFHHALMPLPGEPLRGDDARQLHEWYLLLLDAVKISSTKQPYNLLVTESWMLLVPRSKEHFGGISVNALGFAGSLLVPDRAMLERVRQAGPMRSLREVSGCETDR